MRRLSTPSLDTIWFLVPVLLVVWATLLHPLRHLDFWWHLKVGEIIVENGHIPTNDIFSFTEHGKSFVHQNWLAEVFFYIIWKVGGAELLIFVNTLLMTASFLVICAVAAMRVNYSRFHSLFMLVAAFSFALYSNLRTQTFSFLFLSLFLLILWRYYFQRGYRTLWLLPVIMMFWVNIHGAFTIGLITLILFLGNAAIEYALLRQDERSAILKAQFRQLIIITILTVVATLVNPFGVAIYRSVQQVMTDPSSQLFVTEWQSPRVTNPEHLLTFFIPFFSVLLILTYSQRKPDLLSIGIFLLFAALGLTSVRNGIWFSIAVIPIAAWYIEETPLQSVFSRIFRSANRRPKFTSIINWSILGALVAMTILLNPWVRPRLGIEVLRPSLIDPRIPVGAMEYIEREKITDRIFHHQDFGDYMIWRLWPQQYTFVDGRVHLFSYQVVRDYLDALSGSHWEEIMTNYNISYIFLPKPSRDEMLPLLEAIQQSESWKSIYEDDKSVIFQRLVPSVYQSSTMSN